MSTHLPVKWDWCRTTSSPANRWPRLSIPDDDAVVDIDRLGKEVDAARCVELDIYTPAAARVAPGVIDQLQKAGWHVFALRIGSGVALPEIFALATRCPDLAMISADNQDVPLCTPTPHPIWWIPFSLYPHHVPGPSGPGTSPTLMWREMGRCRFRGYARIDPVIPSPFPPALTAAIGCRIGNAGASVYTHMRMLAVIRARCTEEAEYARAAVAGDARAAGAPQIAQAARDYLRDCGNVTKEVLPDWAGHHWYDCQLQNARRACLWLRWVCADVTGKCIGDVVESMMPHVEAALRMAMETDADDNDDFLVPGPAAPRGTCLLQCDARPGCGVGPSVRTPAATLCCRSIVAQMLVAGAQYPRDGVWHIQVPLPVRGAAMMAFSATLGQSRTPVFATGHDYSFGALCEALAVAHFLNMPRAENCIIRAMTDMFFTHHRGVWGYDDVP